MAGVGLKIQILKKSIATFSSWLDSCDELLDNLPAELESCKPSMLRELALKYKDLLLQMKERCSYIQEVNGLCKEVGEETSSQSSHDDRGQSSPPTHVPDLADLATEVRDLNNRFTTMCIQAKQHYTDLSNALNTAIDDRSSLKSFSFSTASPPVPEGRASRLSDNGAAPHDHTSHTNANQTDSGKEVKGHTPVKLRGSKSPKNEKRAKLRRKRSKSVHLSEEEEPKMEISALDQSPPRIRRSRSWSTPTDLDELLEKKNAQDYCRDNQTTDSTSSRIRYALGLTSGAATKGSSANDVQTASDKQMASDALQVHSHTPDKTVNSDFSRLPATHKREEVKHENEVSVVSGRQETQLNRVEAINRADHNTVSSKLVRQSSAQSNSDHSTHSYKDSRKGSTQSNSSDFERTRGTASPSGSLRGSKRSNRRPRSALFVTGSDSSLAQFYYLGDRDPDSPRAIPDLDTSNCNSPVLKLSPGLKVDSSHNTPPNKMSVIVQKQEPIGGLFGGQRSLAQSLNDLQQFDHLASPDSFISHQQGSTNQNTSVMSDISDGSSFIGSNSTVHVVEGWRSGGGEGVCEARRSKSMDELATVAGDGGKKEKDLSSRLSDLSFRLQEFVHTIAESRRCALQSLALELQLGEVKAMLTILEVHDEELTRLRATFSPLAKRKLENTQTLKSLSYTMTYSEQEIVGRREDIIKLSERVGLLKLHCGEAVEQTEEVLEFVEQYEKEFKVLKDFLTSHASNVEDIKKKIKVQPEESWQELSEELTTVSEKKSQLKAIHELSVHLLYLEPIFDGGQVREDLRSLTEKFQSLTLRIFGLLEDQAKLQTEQLLMETSVMSSWVSEASLSVQALAKKTRKPNTLKAKLIATKETLCQELYKNQTSLEAISNKLRPLIAVLNPDDDANLDALVRQADTNRRSLDNIEANLQAINIGPATDNLQSHGHLSASQGFRSMTLGERGRNKHEQFRSRTFSDTGDPYKSKGQLDDLKTLPHDNEDHYAEIGSFRTEILGKRFPNGGSLVPGPNLKGGVARGPGNIVIREEKRGSSLYASVEEVLSSPFVDYDHVPSRPLDSAIEQLPRSPAPSLPHTPTHSPSHSSTPKRTNGKSIQYVEIDVALDRDPAVSSKSSSVSSLDRLQGQRSPDPTYAEIGKKSKVFPEYADISKFRKSNYSEIKKVTSSPDIRQGKRLPKYTEIDIPKPTERSSDQGVKKKPVSVKRRKRSRRFSLHEELLEFIGEEWAEISLKKTTHQAALDEASLDQSLSHLSNPEHKAMCQKFVRGVREVGAGVQGIVDQISILRPPETPDLERVHSAIDQCQKLLERLNKLHPRLDSYNSESINLIGLLGRSPTCARVSQLIEIRLFEISTLWYSANLKVSSHMQELRSQEGEINYLYRQLQKLSRALKEGTSLLTERKTLTNVDSYLNRCKVMYGKLNDLSDLRGQVASDIRETITQNPQSSVSQELLDQLQQINTKWANLAKELSQMPSLEPLLIKMMFTNIAGELATMKTTFKTFELRVPRVEEAQTNCKTCQVHLEKARHFLSALKSTESKLVILVNKSSQLSPTLLPLNGQDSSSHTKDSSQENGHATGSLASGDGQTHSEVASELTSGRLGQGVPVSVGVDDSTVNCNDLQLWCGKLLKQVGKFVTETENMSSQLQNEFDLITQFYDELHDLQLWMSDTLSMLQLSATAGQTSSANGTTSVSQLRGKHQAIFQQIVTRQPKLISVQSLSEKLILLPSNQSDKQLVDKQVSDLCTQWDDLCKQIVPAGSLPQVMTPTGGGRRLQFEPPSEFEDVLQMVEWLSLIEFKLQPVMVTVGDMKQIQRCLQDLLMIESEIRSRERDYNRFVSGSSIPASLQSDSLFSDQEPELSSTVKSLLGLSTPEGVYQVPSKTVKFHDENTLERHFRHQEISDRNTDDGNEELDSDTPLVSPDGSLTRYHAEGPEAGYRNGIAPKTRTGMGLDLTGGMEQGLQGMGDSLSLTSLSSQLMSIGSVSDDIYQLVLLWKGVWSGLSQARKRLESTLMVWKHFETKKEEFCNFLSKVEVRVSSFYKTLSECKDLTVVQTEITAQQAFVNDTKSYEQKLSSLNELSQDLINNRHSDDDTSDLQDMMADLNRRWKKMMESVSQNQPTLTSLVGSWSEFYREYQSFQQWIKNLDMDMSNLNPFVNDLAAVKIQLEKQKEIQHELTSRDGGMEAVRLLAYKLLQGNGGCHINATAVHSRLDNLGRRLNHLETLAQERRSALENALTEKQDFLSHLADCLAWLNQAEAHLSTQTPLGTDFDTVHVQFEAQQTFWKELVEQQPKIESVIALGNRLANESHWPQGTGEELRSQFAGVDGRWRKISTEGEEWGKLLESVHPEMEVFQTLCSECGQKLSDSELIAGKLESVSRKLPILEQQLAALDVFEASLVADGNVLEAIVLSQRKQVQLGVKVTSDLYQLVKRFHQRWNQLKRTVDERRVGIQRAQIKYDPANLSTAELPVGWKRAATESGTPYFINTAAGNRTQWEHPDLSTFHSTLQARHSLTSYPSPAYAIALKLRALQQRTKLSLLHTRHCMELYNNHTTDPAHKSSSSNHLLSFYDMIVLTVDMFQKVEEELEKGEGLVAGGNQFYINRAVELTTCWIRDVFDLEHGGKVDCTSVQLAIVCLSRGKLEDKYKALFKVISGGQSSIDLGQLTSFLEQVMTIGQSVSETPFCSLRAVDVCARECFRKYVGVGRLQLPQFISWLQTEPPPLSWLPILHRLAASEHAHHDVKCSVCKTHPIIGFRYHCVQCTGFDMCQACYWSGQTGKGHDRTKHFMEEYCMPKPADEVKDFFKTIRKSFRLKKKHLQTDPAQQPHPVPHKIDIPKKGGANYGNAGTPVERRWTSIGKRNSPATSKRHTTYYVPVHIGESHHHSSTTHRESSGGGESHPGRRFTVLEDTQSAWRMSTEGARANTRRASSPPPSVPEASSRRWGRSQRQRPPIPDMRPRDLDASLTKISQTRKSLSFRLRSLREKQGSPTPQEDSDQEGEEVGSERNRGRSPTPEDELRRRNAMLQGRVQLLQEHNLRLENCISQLKLIASIQQPSLRQSTAPQHKPPSLPPPKHTSAGNRPNPPPLPSRPLPPDIYDIPPSSLAARTGTDYYDLPPAKESGGSEVYDVPPNHASNGVPELYSIPVPSSRASNGVSELYSVPVPSSRASNGVSDLYSVPGTSVARRTSSSSDYYDVPPPVRSNGPSDLYDIPPPTAALLKKSNNHSSLETYSIPPPRLISASRALSNNPNIPPPKLPRRTNTAPANSVKPSSSTLL